MAEPFEATSKDSFQHLAYDTEVSRYTSVASIDSALVCTCNHSADSDDESSTLDGSDATSKLETSSEEATPVDMDAVEYHLETMNGASEEMNTVQNELASMRQRRHQCVEWWKDQSANLVRAFSGVDITKAALYYECERQCRLAHCAVVTASGSYSQAAAAGARKASLEALAARHVQSIDQYQSALRCLSKVQKSSKLSKEALSAALPYYDAEVLHLQELAKLDVAINQLVQRFADAKALYRSALQGLEAISDDAHRRRSDQY